jgi:hypothetical protein
MVKFSCSRPRNRIICLEMIPEWSEYIVEIITGGKAMGNVITLVITMDLKGLRACSNRFGNKSKGKVKR